MTATSDLRQQLAEAAHRELAEGSPLLSALNPGTRLPGSHYVKGVDAESGRYLHLREGRLHGDDGPGALGRISLDAVDAGTLRAHPDAGGQPDKGPFARPLNA